MGAKVVREGTSDFGGLAFWAKKAKAESLLLKSQAPQAIVVRYGERPLSLCAPPATAANFLFLLSTRSIDFPFGLALYLLIFLTYLPSFFLLPFLSLRPVLHSGDGKCNLSTSPQR